MGEYNSKIRGTSETLFRVGLNGPQVKNVTDTILEARNEADDGYVIVRGADPVGANDLLTKSFFEANNAAANGQTMVKLPLVQASKTSTTVLPDNATIERAIMDVEVAYDANAQFLIDRTGDATVILMANGDSKMTKVGQYEVPQITNWGVTGAGTVQATLTNSPTVGSAIV